MVDRNDQNSPDKRLSHDVLPVVGLFGFACCLGEWRAGAQHR